MAPNSVPTPLGEDSGCQKMESKKSEYKMELKWGNIIKLSIVHYFALFATFRVLQGYGLYQTVIFYTIVGILTAIGTTAGSHRLWTHKSYKAKLPLRLLLALFSTVGVQNHIYDWVRDHRVHHKYSETDADPHNIKRGFFFAHCGWLMCKKHEDVIRKGKTVDLSDLLADPVVYYQRKYYTALAIVFGFLIPITIPWYFWGEPLWHCFLGNWIRYVCVLHGTWSVNSAAHMYGDRPYDLSMDARENRLVSFWALGEGFHNYHHAFPWDYSTSEWRWSLNLTTLFIDFMSKIGWAYDLKYVSKRHLEERIKRTGKVVLDHHHDD